MDTLIQQNTVSVSAPVEKTKTTSAVSQFLNDLETNRFGFAPLILVAMACLGGIAAGFAVKGSDVSLMAVAISTSFVEILIIALAPMRMIAAATVIAFIVDLLVFIF